jgi:hypothetical protein
MVEVRVDKMDAMLSALKRMRAALVRVRGKNEWLDKAMQDVDEGIHELEIRLWHFNHPRTVEDYLREGHQQTLAAILGAAGFVPQEAWDEYLAAHSYDAMMVLINDLKVTQE